MAEYWQNNPVVTLFPIKTVYTGSACTFCETISPNLVACTACKVAKYCGRVCQTKSWKEQHHKHVCKILQAFRSSYSKVNVAEENYGVVTLLNHYNDMMKSTAPELSSIDNAEAMTVLARHYIRGCRVCSICHKTEYDIPSGKKGRRHWRHCSKCQFGWCCSKEHWEHYKAGHTREICATYRESIEIERFGNNHIRNYNDTFLECPQTPLRKPMRVFPSCWDEYFALRCADSWRVRDRLPAPYFKEATRELSQPVNCLHAMYLHGIDHFKKLTRLTIHVVGAGPSYEFLPTPTCIWEEIMHCLPKVKELNIMFVGPELENVCTPPTINAPLSSIEACPDCIGKGRIRRQGWYAKTWHEYAADRESFVSPDLIVAFNTGMSMEETESWRTSLDAILDTSIPCLFTMYNEEEGRGDCNLLKLCGAHTLTDAAQLNPFSVNVPSIDPSEVDKFFKINHYYVCFKGRSV